MEKSHKPIATNTGFGAMVGTELTITLIFLIFLKIVIEE